MCYDLGSTLNYCECYAMPYDAIGSVYPIS